MAKQKNGEHRSLIDALKGVAKGTSLSAQEMVESLQEEGYKIVRDDPASLAKPTVDIVTEAKERWGEGGIRVRFGVVSDTQLGSRKQQITFLRKCYRRFVDEGIDTVLHAGDLCDGDGRVYPGQQFDLHVHGFKRQLDYIVDEYPYQESIRTFVIAGNHDWSFWQRGGADILAEMVKSRPDVTYLGYGGASLMIEGISVYLIHLKSGLTYARSYKLQKIIEQFAPAQKPDMLFAGDRHSWADIPMYRNVFGVQMGCFQAQTDHERRLGLYPEIGGLLVDAYADTAGSDKRDQTRPGHQGRRSIVEIGWRVLPLYVPLDDDY